MMKWDAGINQKIVEVAMNDIQREANLSRFLTESNRIEGEGPPSEKEMAAAIAFLDGASMGHLKDYVYETSGAKIRDKQNMNVRVGNHIAPRGGKEIEKQLSEILALAGTNRDPEMAYRNHINYENLHPFMDGNGRSGRLIWYYQMNEYAPIGFLQKWYYQTLEFSGR